MPTAARDAGGAAGPRALLLTGQGIQHLLAGSGPAPNSRLMVVNLGRMTITDAPLTQAPTSDEDVLARARRIVLEEGKPLGYDDLVEVLRTGDDRLEELLQLAHEVRLKYNGDEVEVEGIVSLKTGGCPEDCHFCSQSGQFTSPVRSVWLNIPQLVRAAKQTRETGAGTSSVRVIVPASGSTAEGVQRRAMSASVARLCWLRRAAARARR